MKNEFDKSLKSVVQPALKKYGYNFNGKRQFIKENKNGKKLIIEYQVGVRAAQGAFTVNLIIGDNSERLNMIKPTLLSKVINSIFGKYDPWWKGMFLPKDKWWKISPFQSEMDSILFKTVKEVEAYGLSWLERNSAT